MQIGSLKLQCAGQGIRRAGADIHRQFRRRRPGWLQCGQPLMLEPGAGIGRAGLQGIAKEGGSVGLLVATGVGRIRRHHDIDPETFGHIGQGDVVHHRGLELVGRVGSVHHARCSVSGVRVELHLRFGPDVLARLGVARLGPPALHAQIQSGDAAIAQQEFAGLVHDANGHAGVDLVIAADALGGLVGADALPQRHGVHVTQAFQDHVGDHRRQGGVGRVLAVVVVQFQPCQGRRGVTVVVRRVGGLRLDPVGGAICVGVNAGFQSGLPRYTGDQRRVGGNAARQLRVQINRVIDDAQAVHEFHSVGVRAVVQVRTFGFAVDHDRVEAGQVVQRGLGWWWRFCGWLTTTACGQQRCQQQRSPTRPRLAGVVPV